LRSFIRVIDPCEAPNLSGSGFPIEALWVAFFTELDWGVDEDLYEIAFFHCDANTIPVTSIRADKGGEGDKPGLAEQFGHGSYAPDVFFSIFSRESKAKPLGEFFAVAVLEYSGTGIESVAHIVAIE
jgi:hypothetical protein